MKKTKSILIFAFLISTYITLSGFTNDVKAETYTMPEGTEFTLTMTAPTEGNISVKVISSSATAVTGDIAATSEGKCEVTANTDLTSLIWGRTMIDGSVAALSSFQNVTYAGRTVEAHVVTDLTSSIQSVVVMNSTGIILNITSSTLGIMYLTSWTYDACPFIPGYELPILLTVAGFSILGIIYYVRNKKI